MRYIYVSFLVLFSFIQLGISQQLTHQLGEVIVQVDNNRDFHQMVRTIGMNNSKMRNLSYSQICQEPLNLWLVKSDPNTVNEINLLDNIISNEHVAQAQRNHLISYRTIPNDPEFVKQWQYINDGVGGKLDADLDIDDAWETTTGGTTASGDKIVACIIDDGIYKDHEDLKNRLWKNEAEIPNNGIDDDNNGWVDDYLGWDPARNIDTAIYFNGSHGTPVAAIIGAEGNNSIGVSGVNWDVELMIVRGGGDEAQALAAYAYPYYFRKRYNETNGAEGALVVTTNASWGSDYKKAEEAPIWCEFYNKMGEVGILSCGATANNNVNVDIDGDLPTTCTSDYLISVTNMTRFDLKKPNAGFGAKSIDLGAFGSQTWTARTNDNYGTFGGTSGATPHVAGTVALLYSIPCLNFSELYKSHPALAARYIKQVILSGVDPIPSLKQITVTGGRLNINNSMDLAMELCGEMPYPTDGSIDTEYKLSWTNPENSTQTNMRYRIVDADDWIISNNIQSPYAFNGLELCTNYEVQLQTVYTGSDKSDFSFSYKIMTTGCCYAPTALDYNLVGNNQVNITWNSYEESIANTIEYKKENATHWTSETINSDSYTISNLENCTSYMSRLKSSCDVSNSILSDTLYFSSECGNCTNSNYCTDIGEPDNGGEWIARVQFGTLDNSSGAEENAYGDYLGVDIPSVKTAEEYDITITPAYSGQVFSDYYKVWIDFNQDEVFDTSEVVFEPINNSSQEVTGSISIPEDAVLGTTRMRIFISYNQNPKACNDSSFDFGEVEDYCVEIVDELFSVNPIEKQYSISVSPNPFSSHINLKTQNIDVNKISVVLKNINGNKIFTENNINVNKTLDNIKLESLNDLPNGIYFLSVIMGKELETIKILKI